MALSERSNWATLSLFVLGAFGLASAVFLSVGYRMGTFPTMLLGSGIVTYAVQMELVRASAIAAPLKYGAVAAFFALSFGVHRRVIWAAVLAIVFVTVDAAFLFMPNPDPFSGLFASLQLPFHALVCWWTFDAIRAIRQGRANEDIVRNLDFQHRLRRRLEESDEPAPPAATFDTRFRRLPPGAI
ncbi:MAG TPA: hypothetical protein VFO25_04310 [Candidatus Eremiobacteraceae bacterium]|nr:hypothetical protein [Candidatus Eremiobacteraceae bacterium]